jgi:NtrC-family two-component system sensor histidine kinase KinB
MTLRWKLLAALAVPTALLSGVGVLAVVSIGRLAATADTILADNYRSIQAVRRMREAVLALESFEADAARDAARVGPLVRDFEGGLRAGEMNITESTEDDLLRGLRADWDAYAGTLGGGRDAAAGDATKRQLGERILRQTAALLDVNERAMYRHQDATRSEARALAYGLGAVVAVTVAMLLAFSRLAAGRISAPIMEAADNLNRILAADAMRDEIDRSTGGEIERLRSEVDGLLVRLRAHERVQDSRLASLRQRLSVLMEQVHDGIVLVDETSRLIAFNAAGREILGLAEGDASGRLFLDVLRDERLGPAFASFTGGRPLEPQDLPELRATVRGAERVFRPRVTPVAGEGNVPPDYLVVFWDVTRQRQVDEARRRFIAMLSHQLKTPLTSLTMSVELLRERLRGAGPETDEFLNLARGDCNSFRQLIDELIQAAKDVGASLAIRHRRVDVRALLSASLRPLAAQAAEKGVRFLELLGDGDAFAHVDPVKLPWVVTNIVGNALRYTPPGGEVRVALGADAGHVDVTIEDTGRGIARDDLERLFQPFVSLESDGAPERHGLGLAVAKEIVEAHGGTLGVQSELGRGTSFAIRLPRGDERDP